MTGIDDHSRFVVCAKVVLRATARPVCLALAEALRRHGVPREILTDNGKVFTGRFGAGPGPVMFDRICADNGIRHLLTAPYSPATTGKVERLHKTMRAEFFTARPALRRLARTCRRRWTGGWSSTTPPGRTSPAAAGHPPSGSSSRTGPWPLMTPRPPTGRGPGTSRGGGEAPGGGVAVGERGREDLPGRVQLRGRRDLRR